MVNQNCFNNNYGLNNIIYASKIRHFDIKIYENYMLDHTLAAQYRSPLLLNSSGVMSDPQKAVSNITQYMPFYLIPELNKIPRILFTQTFFSLNCSSNFLLKINGVMLGIHAPF